MRAREIRASGLGYSGIWNGVSRDGQYLMACNAMTYDFMILHSEYREIQGVHICETYKCKTFHTNPSIFVLFLLFTSFIFTTYH